MNESTDIASELRKVANLLALRQVGELSKGRAVMVLSTAGFSNREIAALIATSESSVRGMLSMARRRGGAEE